MFHILLPLCPAKREELMGREIPTWSHCYCKAVCAHTPPQAALTLVLSDISTAMWKYSCSKKKGVAIQTGGLFSEEMHQSDSMDGICDNTDIIKWIQLPPGMINPH